MRSKPASQGFAFRFGLICATLLIFPFPIWLFAPDLASALFKPWAESVRWFAERLGIERPPLVHSGSGDTLFHYVELLWVVTLATVSALAWTLLARRRSHARLAAVATVILRYYLATTLLGYGLAKVVPMQFPPPWLGRYDQAIGEMSPMGLLWTFMGHSRAYTLFAGLAECAGAVLLLWRRTYVIGAVVTAIVMTNVVALNFCYDVPVKLFSTELLVIAALIAWPQLHRLVRAVLGGAVAEVPPRVRSSARVERLRLVAKVGVIAIVAWGLYQMHEQGSEYRRPPSELAGLWRVDTFRKDGVELPALMTDAERWCSVGFSTWYVSVRACHGEHLMVQAEILPAAQLIVLGLEEAELLRYVRHGDHLTIDGVHRGKPIHVTLTRQPPPLLVSRGFHWIQEFPFNR